MVSYYEGVIAREIAKTLAKRGKIKKTGRPNVDFRGRGGDLEEDREPRVTYSTPPKSELKSRLRESQKEKKKDERAKERRPKEVKVSVSAFMRYAKKREKVIMEGGPRPSAWTFKGTIEGVKENYVVVSSVAGYTRKTFMIEETTGILKVERTILWGQKPKIIENKQKIELVDLKKGMNASVRYIMKHGNMVAKWIKISG